MQYQNFNKNLKEESYYSDLYDKFTIEQCQEIESDDISKSNLLNDKNEQEKAFLINIYKKAWIPMHLYYRKAERAVEKTETIKKWMDVDKGKDQKLIQVQQLEGKECIECGSILEQCTSRDLMHRNGSTEEVLFMFTCGSCQKPQAFWENGERWKYIPKCEKCNKNASVEHDRKGNILKTKITCQSCDHVEIDEMNLDEKYQEEIDPNFEKNRKKYCISELEGNEIIRESEQTSRLLNDFKKEDEIKKEKEALENIKRLTVFGVQELLRPFIEKSKYANLSFDKPEIGKDIIMGFNTQEADSSREEWDSIHDLERLIKKESAQTNWRLMSDGVSYKLGYLNGRIRGYDQEDDLLKLVSRELKKDHN
jgi:hypothetical protein